MLKFTCLDAAHPRRLLLLFLSCSSPVHPASPSSHSSSIPCHHLASAWAPASPPLPLVSQSPSTHQDKALPESLPSSRGHTGLWHCRPPSVSLQPLYCFATLSDHFEGHHSSERRRLGFEPDKPGFGFQPSYFQAL